MNPKIKTSNFKFFKKRNVKLFSFFLAAAFFFLMLTKFSETYTQTINLEIELYNLEDDMVVLNDSFVSAEAILNAKGFSLISYLFNPKKKVLINAQSDAVKKDKRLFWDIAGNKYKLKKLFGNSIDIVSIKPDTVFFNYDVLASKYVPVELIKEINYLEGFDVVRHLKLSQDSVKIIGSKMQIDSIVKLKTEPLVLNEVNSNIAEQISIENEFTNIRTVPEILEVEGDVRRFTEGKLLLPITPINTLKDKQINFFPKQAELVFYVDIDNYKTIKEDDFQIIADFSQLSNENQNTLNLEIVKSPDIVKNVRLLQNSIEFIISD